MKYWIGIAVVFCMQINGFAQGEASGSYVSNYAGANAVQLNPSALHNQKVWLSVNLLGANLFLNTDFAYLNKDEFKLTDLLNPNYVLPAHSTGYGVEERFFYSYDSKQNTSFNQSLHILGPSAMLAFNQHAIAITSGFRAETNLRNLTPDLANILAYGFSFFPQYLHDFQINDFSGTSLAWAEIGLSYAYRIDREKFDNWSFGFSLKKLMGIGGGYLNVSKSTYSLIDSKTINVANQVAELGFALPIDYNTNAYLPDELKNGRGWAMDLGFTYQNLIRRQPKLNANKFCDQPNIDYKYRLGVALLDIGGIDFKQNAQTHDFSSSAQATGDLNDAILESVNQVVQLISEEFYGSASASLVSNSMHIALPMSLSAQFDYNTQWHHFYWNTSLIYGFPLKGGALRRPSKLSIAPRYETKMLEIGVPLSIYQFQKPYLGIYARYGPFLIGSDWFSSLLGNKNFNGLDLYFSLKFQLAKQSCTSKRKISDACSKKIMGF
jgi:hypothetical protein